MNSVIKKMSQHVSVRQFKDEPLSEATKHDLLVAAQSGSSSNFVQAFSIIEISDEKIKNELAEISNSAPYVKQSGVFYVFVADLYRQSVILEKQNLPTAGISNMEQLLVATVDTTIAAEDMAVAAESMGLGICYIGGIRNDVNRVAELLKLPKYTFPLFGLTIGIPAHKNQVKPRLPLSQQVAQNTYSAEQFTNIVEYDQEVSEYYSNRAKNKQDTSWTEKNLDFFKTVRREDVAEFLRTQGFSLN